MKLLPINWGAIFISQILPGGVVIGDVVRLKFLNDEFKVNFKRGFLLILLERVLMLFILGATVIATFWVLPSQIILTQYIQWLYVVSFLLFVIFSFFYKLIPRSILFFLRKLKSKWPQLVLAILSSFVILFLSIAVFTMLAHSFNSEIEFWLYIPLCSVVLMISAIPVSFAGWGLREGGCLLLLPIFGFSNEEAVVVSIAFGLLTFISSFPGIFHGLQLLLKLWGQAAENTKQIKVKLHDALIEVWGK